MPLTLNDFTGRSAEEALMTLKSGSQGLSATQASDFLKLYGSNELKAAPKRTLLQKLWESFIEPMVLILFGATVFSFLIGDWIEGLAILGVVMINTVISLIQDAKAEKALDELKKMLSPTFKVLRDGKLEILAVKFLVPGDIILFEAGDIIPADVRITDAQSLLVDEAHLTGESEPVKKNAAAISTPDLKPYEAKNCLFTGSKVLDGKGRAVVYATGGVTEMGKIAAKIQEEETEKTPLQQRLAKETKFLVTLAFLSAAFVLLVVFFKNWGIIFGAEGFSLRIAEEAILLAITILVAVFPEGLPASITIALSLAVERLAKQSVIVKKLSSVETLGNVDYICTDKTGTITAHKMTAKEYFLGRQFYTNTDLFKLLAEGQTALIQQIFLIATKCSSASIEEKEGTILRELGDPTELAILKSALLSGFKPGEFDADTPVLDHLPFSSDNMFSAALVEEGTSRRLLVQGAPEKLLLLSTHFAEEGKNHPFDESIRRHFLKELGTRQEKGYRLIAFATAPFEGEETKIEASRVLGLTFLGACVIFDPPKDEVKQVIAEAKAANIAVVMITGDAKKTGFAIAESVGIANDPTQAIEGRELEALTEEEFDQRVENYRVYSRVVPMDKLRIVEKLREKGHVTAMTGDGVNDAPALKKSHVGIAMGRAGTQVSQEAADIILTDDNFSTIVTAVKEGRTVFANLKKVVKYLITNNIGKVVTTLLTPLLGPGASLNALMLLWSNVVMETAPGVGLSTDPPGPDIMKQKPAKITDPILWFSDRLVMFLDGLIFGLVITAGYLLILNTNAGLGAATSQALAQTAAFVITLLSPQLYVFVLREGRFIRKFTAPNKLLKGFTVFMILMIPALVFIPALNSIFKTMPITDPAQWVLILGLSLITPLFRLFAGLLMPAKADKTA